MPATGEFIRAMNYVDDIAATLRRISIYIPGLDADEKRRLADHLHSTATAVSSAISELEKAGQ